MILGHIDAVKLNYVWTTNQGHWFVYRGPSVPRLSLLISLAILLSETVVMVLNAQLCFSDGEDVVNVSSTTAGRCCTTEVELNHYSMSCLSDANVTMGLCKSAEHSFPLIIFCNCIVEERWPKIANSSSKHMLCFSDCQNKSTLRFCGGILWPVSS